jgi:uncharacterized membrane-anchored protein
MWSIGCSLLSISIVFVLYIIRLYLADFNASDMAQDLGTFPAVAAHVGVLSLWLSILTLAGVLQITQSCSREKRWVYCSVVISCALAASFFSRRYTLFVQHPWILELAAAISTSGIAFFLIHCAIKAKQRRRG